MYRWYNVQFQPEPVNGIKSLMAFYKLRKLCSIRFKLYNARMK